MFHFFSLKYKGYIIKDKETKKSIKELRVNGPMSEANASGNKKIPKVKGINGHVNFCFILIINLF